TSSSSTSRGWTASWRCVVLPEGPGRPRECHGPVVLAGEEPEPAIVEPWYRAPSSAAERTGGWAAAAGGVGVDRAGVDAPPPPARADSGSPGAGGIQDHVGE